MNLQPFLNGELLELRPLKQEDFTALYEAASDPLIWEQHPQPTRYQPEVFRSFFAEAMASGGALVIVDRKTSKIIGSSRFYNFDQQKKSVVVGYTFVARKYWGGVYNRELKKLMVNHALKDVKAVFFHVGLNNIRSQKALLKIGAVNVGIEDIEISYGPPKKSFVFKIENPL